MTPTSIVSDDRLRHRGFGVVVLAGGQSRRMGRDKADLLFQGQSFLESLITRFYEAEFNVVVVENQNSALRDRSQIFSRFERVRFVVDEHADYGPLEGVRVGLKYLQSLTEFAFVTACDNPLIKLELVNALFDQRKGAQAVIPRSDRRVFGLTAVYRTDIHHLIGERCRLGHRAVRELGQYLKTNWIDLADLRQFDPSLDSFLNINSEDDYLSLIGRNDSC